MIKFEPLHPDVKAPTYATTLSAGYDLRAYLSGREVTVYTPNNTKFTTKLSAKEPSLVLMTGERAMVPLGFKAALPWYLEGQIRPRSGKALKVGLGVVNSPGTIDADYAHEWAVLVVNLSTVPLVIDHDEAIAQLVLARYEREGWVEDEVLPSTNRSGGFGSTGT